MHLAQLQLLPAARLRLLIDRMIQPLTMRLATLVALFALAGCAPRTPMTLPGVTNVETLDFRPFAQQGFLFAPGDYSQGDYEPIGIVTVTAWPPATRRDLRVSAGSEGRLINLGWDWQIDYVDPQTTLGEMHRRAVALGADAVVDFTATAVVQTLSAGDEIVTIPGVRLSGFAIRRTTP